MNKSLLHLVILVVAIIKNTSQRRNHHYLEYSNGNDADAFRKFLALHSKRVLQQFPPVVNGPYLNYTLGSRLPGDKFLTMFANNRSLEEPQNVLFILTYPSRRSGATVTYVNVVVEQTSSEGTMILIHGGLNARSISLVVWGSNTTSSNYVAKFYGFPKNIF